MSYEKILNDTLNYAIESNEYLEQVKNEIDQEKRFNLLKKYFTEKITKNLYHSMDLLNTAQTDFNQFKNMYILIAKDLFLNIILAADTLIGEKHSYHLNTSHIDICGDINDIDNNTNNEYSICRSYIDLNH